jgi:hypothetical protein
VLLPLLRRLRLQRRFLGILPTASGISIDHGIESALSRYSSQQSVQLKIHPLSVFHVL